MLLSDRNFFYLLMFLLSTVFASSAFNPCHSMPCANDGRCYATVSISNGSFVCKCPACFTSETCEQRIQSCIGGETNENLESKEDDRNRTLEDRQYFFRLVAGVIVVAVFCLGIASSIIYYKCCKRTLLNIQERRQTAMEKLCAKIPRVDTLDSIPDLPSDSTIAIRSPIFHKDKRGLPLDEVALKQRGLVDIHGKKLPYSMIMRQQLIDRLLQEDETAIVAFFPVHIGDHVFIEESAIVIAAQIGSYVHVGKNCVIGKRTILRDCCAVMDDSILAPDTVVPPFAIMAGSPAKIVGELPNCTQELMVDASKSYYERFIPESAAS